MPDEDPEILNCGDCGAPMVLRSSKYGPFYGCSRWPDCKGTHGAHPDGKPKGTPADANTRKARVTAHRVFDEIWKRDLVRNRGAAYSWMRKAMNLGRSAAHISLFTVEQCETLVQLVHRDYPALRNRWTYLIADPLEEEDPFLSTSQQDA